MAKLLIVDDDQQIRDLLNEYFVALGYDVHMAKDSFDALLMIKFQSFDIVLLDLNLPGQSGQGLLETIRKCRPRTMVLITSGRTDFESSVEAFENGAFAFIRKPFVLDDLKKIVDSALEEGCLMRESSYVFKDKRRHDNRLIQDGAVYAISDSLLAGIIFFWSFLLHIFIFSRVQIPFYLASIELYQMSLGMVFCYAFIFILRKSHRIDLIDSRRYMASHLFRNLAQAFILYLAIIAILKDINLSAYKFALGCAFVLSFGGLILNRFVILPLLGLSENQQLNEWLSRESGHVLEGKRSLRFVMPADSMPEVRDATVISAEGNRMSHFAARRQDQRQESIAAK